MIRVVLSLLLVATSPSVAVGTGPPHAHLLFRFADPRITEASGIARGLASPGVFYVENDSGDSNRFFAVDRRTGETAATILVTGARNADWEDLAVADDRGTPSVWLADIGDNDAVRRSVQVYEVGEPRIDPAWRNRTVRVPVVHEWKLRYPGGPTDAESFAVAPGGTPYIVTKSFGSAAVYRVPPWRPGRHLQTVHRVGAIGFHDTGTANPFGLLGQLTATGAAISTTGSVLAVRTYADVWLWRIAGPIAETLRRKPVVVPLPRQPQGEGVTVLDHTAVVDSEHPRTGVYSVPLPRRLTRPRRVSVPSPPATPRGETTGADSTEPWWWVGGGVVALGALVGGTLIAARRRR